MEQWLSLWSIGQNCGSEDFEKIKAVGFDGVEIWAEHQCAIEYMEYAKEYGLKIGLHLPFHDLNLASPDDVIGDRVLSVNTKWLQILAKYNGEHAVLHGGYAWLSEERDTALLRVKERLTSLANVAKNNQLDLLLENLIPDRLNYCYNIASNIEEWASLVSEANIKACLDTGHLAVMGASIREAFEKLGNKIATVHYDDNDGVADLHLLPGDGNNVVEGLLETVEHHGYQCPIVYEINPYKYTLDDIMDFSKRSV